MPGGCCEVRRVGLLEFLESGQQSTPPAPTVLLDSLCYPMKAKLPATLGDTQGARCLPPPSSGLHRPGTESTLG